MTGFGLAQTLNSDIEIDVSIKTLNSRFLECNFKLPVLYQAYEAQLKGLLQKQIHRGRVDIVIRRKTGESIKPYRAVVQVEMAREWLEGYRKLGKELKLLAEPSLDMLSRLQDVIRVEELQELLPKEEKILIQVFQEAIKLCDQEREREGRALEANLNSLVGELLKIHSKLKKLKSTLVKSLQKKYQEKIKKIEAKIDASDPRFLQEVAILLDKSDISEELSRLEEHLKNFKRMLKSTDILGKKLEFYTQELLREVNTIGSKSQDLGLTELVVEAKAVIEKIREQVQNIE